MKLACYTSWYSRSLFSMQAIYTIWYHIPLTAVLLLSLFQISICICSSNGSILGMVVEMVSADNRTFSSHLKLVQTYGDFECQELSFPCLVCHWWLAGAHILCTTHKSELNLVACANRWHMHGGVDKPNLLPAVVSKSFVARQSKRSID